MSIENLHQLAQAVRAMREGEMFKIPKADLKTFWPDPDIYKPDDHLSVAERSGKWAYAHDVVLNVEIDPPALRIFKPYTLKPARREIDPMPRPAFDRERRYGSWEDD